jgi:ABC-2 type transport system ATP-binding protein
MNVLETCRLTKRYGRTTALADCTIAVPAGHVVALVGPNGAGKTTLLQLATGLLRPTSGRIAVLGVPVGQSRDRVGFVAQDAALYGGLSVVDLLRLASSLNRRWDAALARDRIDALGIPSGRRFGRLSGGQQAQVALAVAVAKRPDLLLLDEPLARLDPLARHEFLGTLLAAVAEFEISVVFSSHVIAELERFCDYLVVIRSGAMQVAGEVDDLLAEHRRLSGPAATADQVAAGAAIVADERTPAQAHLVLRGDRDRPVPLGWTGRSLSLDELVLAYLRAPGCAALPGPEALLP